MGATTTQHKVTWDYTEHTSHYDKRADYFGDAIENLLKAIGCDTSRTVAAIEAGTGKLTKELLKHGLTVKSIEPNDAMRTIGIQNTKDLAVTWSVGTGEATGLPAGSAGSDSLLNSIVQQIPGYLNQLPKVIDVPYTILIYFAQKVK